ncbi:MAG: hypothetical protein IH592_10330, partial [Bacteroidales bacterium]|nr:hypothetical protein [Bacteroidales bacterium]
MNKSRKTYLALLFAALLPASVSAGGQPLTSSELTEKFERYCRTNPYEELWLQTDRETYVAGETVRIKAYLFSLPGLRFAGKDSYAYVELLDYYNNPVAQITLSVEEGTGVSQLHLPDSLVTGSYLLRAYTSVMKNFLPYGCFMKKITVANPFRNNFLDFCSWLKFTDEPPYEVRFFPESGSLINGLLTTVGISTVNRYGYPVKCNGSLTNTRDELITEISVDSTGIASFEFVPQKGESYFFKPSGTDRKYELPRAADAGFGIRVSGPFREALTILLRERNSDGRGHARGGIVLIQSRGRIVFSRNLPSWSEEYEVSVPVSQLEAGINNVAIFDDNGNFLAERYIFIPSAAEEPPVIDFNARAGRREEIDLEITENRAVKQPVEGVRGSISVSAYSSGDRIITAPEYLMLGSEFRHESFPPGSSANFASLSSKAKNTYLLGIRSNWLDWNRIADGRWDIPPFAGEERGRYIVASLTAPPALPPEGKLTAFLVTWGRKPSFQYARNNKEGRFVFFLERKNEPDDVMIRINDNGNARPLKIESSYPDIYPSNHYMADTTSLPGLQGEVSRLTDRYQVRKIYGISDTLHSQTVGGEEKTNWRFYGVPDQELVLDDYISLSSMREIFYELVKRIAVRSDRKESEPVIWDQILKRAPSLFIDMVPQDEAEKLLSLDPGHVKQIDIISGDYLFGDTVFPGIVNVITRKGNYSEPRLPAAGLRTSYRMSDPPVMFVSPNHSDPGIKSSRIPDLRNTVYWNTGLERDSTGIIRCAFLSPDDSHVCRIMVTLISDEGKIISAVKMIEFKG